MRPVLIVMGMLVLTFLFTKPALADTVCQPIYGGGETCQSSSIVVTKTVVNPQTNTDVHDLGQNDPMFHGGDIVTFHIVIKNTGNASLSNVKLQDNFPQFITFVDGPGSMIGNFLNFTSSPLSPSQSQTFTIRAKVVSNDQLPVGNTINCVINQVTATNNDQTSQDSSQFCVQRLAAGAPTPLPTPQATTPLVTTPATGPSEWSLLLPFITGATGIGIHKLTKGRVKN